MDSKENYIKTLNDFKYLIETWEYGNPTSLTRSEINKKMRQVRTIVSATGASKRMTIAPPPMIGGIIMKNISPFDCIFERPYGM